MRGAGNPAMHDTDPGLAAESVHSGLQGKTDSHTNQFTNNKIS